VFVLLGDGTAQANQTPNADVPSDQSQLIETLQDQIRYLRDQLDAEREARTEEQWRHDTIVAQLTSKIPAIEAPQEATWASPMARPCPLPRPHPRLPPPPRPQLCLPRHPQPRHLCLPRHPRSWSLRYRSTERQTERQSLGRQLPRRRHLMHQHSSPRLRCQEVPPAPAAKTRGQGAPGAVGQPRKSSTSSIPAYNPPTEPRRRLFLRSSSYEEGVSENVRAPLDALPASAGRGLRLRPPRGRGRGPSPSRPRTLRSASEPPNPRSGDPLARPHLLGPGFRGTAVGANEALLPRDAPQAAVLRVREGRLAIHTSSHLKSILSRRIDAFSCPIHPSA